MDISQSQLKLLKRFQKQVLRKSLLSLSDIEDISDLGSNGFIQYSKETDERNSETIILITAKGKARYESYIRESKRWLIPVVLSIVAIVISLFALYHSNQTINVYVNNRAITETTTDKADM